MTIILRRLAAVFLLALPLAVSGGVEAAYPEKPIRLIVVYSPGGASDVVCRILARHLEPVLGQPVVVQNIAGGGGAIGWQQAMDAAPDGYTIAMYADSLAVMEATGTVEFTHNDFDLVAIWGTMALTVFTQKDGPYASLGAYVQAAKEQPGEIGLAMGYGTPSQFVAKIVEDAMGVDLNLLNVGGGAEKKTAVLGGHVDAGIEPMPGMAEPYRGGQFDILAVLSEERLSGFPDIPTAREQGVEALHSNTYAIVAPKGTPEDRLAVLEQAIAEVVESPQFIEDNRKVNFGVDFKGRVETAALLDEVRARMLATGQSLGF